MRSVLKNHVDGMILWYSYSSFIPGHAVPVPHFGVVLEWDIMDELVENMKKHRVKFEIEPYVRFKGQPGEQKTMVRIIDLLISELSFFMIHLETHLNLNHLRISKISYLKLDELNA